MGSQVSVERTNHAVRAFKAVSDELMHGCVAGHEDFAEKVTYISTGCETQPIEAIEVAAQVVGCNVTFPKSGPVNVSSLTRIATSDLGLLPQPKFPAYTAALVQVYVPHLPFGGNDKSSNGHRYDTIPIANGMISAGLSCQLIHYVPNEHDEFFHVLKGFDAIIVRCSPGQIDAAGGDQRLFDEGMRALRRGGKQVWPSPDVVDAMEARTAIVKLAKLSVGLPDNQAYCTPAEFYSGFRKTIAFQPRVIKPCHGPLEHSMWIVRLKDGNYCSSYGARACTDDEMLVVLDATDQHEEEHTLQEFMEWCINGPTSPAAGTWKSRGVGKLFNVPVQVLDTRTPQTFRTGKVKTKALGAQVVDQRFCPRVAEGGIRFIMVGEKLLGIVRKKPTDSINCSTAAYTYHKPDAEQFAHLTDNFLNKDLGKMVASLGLSGEPLPLWWTADFVNAAPHDDSDCWGIPTSRAAAEHWVAVELRCCCVGISKCLAAYCKESRPEAKYTDICSRDLKEADRTGQLIGAQGRAILDAAMCLATGPVDVSGISRMARDDIGILSQPKQPKYKTCVVQVYVRGEAFGGCDKSSNGHRYDTVLFVNGMISAGMSCQPIHYLHEEHRRFFEVCKCFDAVIVRCRPGHIKADGGDQHRFDQGLMALRNLGIYVWPSPKVVKNMGGKDSLVKISHLSVGLPDTQAYYTPQEFKKGLAKTIAFQARVIKQNRGAGGDGVWIVKLKEGDYCRSFGDRACADTEVLILREASSGYEEEHSVAEFFEFCINGRTRKSGKWSTHGIGRYFSGGKESGGFLIDQRFCPRVAESELRFSLVGQELVDIVHKGQSMYSPFARNARPTTYTRHGPKDGKFASLATNFMEKDLPQIIVTLGLASEPLPLWWTTDFINASSQTHEERWTVSGFNCDCAGISRCWQGRCRGASPEACFGDISAPDLEASQRIGAIMGRKALQMLGTRSLGPVDVSALSRIAKDDHGLLMQPRSPRFKVCIVQVYVRRQANGGADKSSNGHRYDSILIANGMINAGMSCQPIHYLHQEFSTFFQVCAGFDAIMVRCSPEQVEADGGTWETFIDGLRSLASKGKQVWPSPDLMEQMSAKDTIVKAERLKSGKSEDLVAYYTLPELEAGLKHSLAIRPRVIKANVGSHRSHAAEHGSGTWLVKLKDEGKYGNDGQSGTGKLTDREILVLQEANDNHLEQHTVGELIDFIAWGRTNKAGIWTSKGHGKYLNGKGACLVDQRFCPRAAEGVLRYCMMGSQPVSIALRRPRSFFECGGDASGVGVEYYAPNDVKFSVPTLSLLKLQLPDLLRSLGVASDLFPFLWSADLMNTSMKYGSDPQTDRWILCSLSCSCVDILPCLQAACCTEAAPDASYDDVAPEDLAEAVRFCNLVGERALKSLLGSSDPISELASSKTSESGRVSDRTPSSHKMSVRQESKRSDQISESKRSDQISELASSKTSDSGRDSDRTALSRRMPATRQESRRPRAPRKMSAGQEAERPQLSRTLSPAKRSERPMPRYL